MIDPGTAHEAADLAPVHVGQADIEDQQIVVRTLGDLKRGGAACGFLDRELFIELKLVTQRFAERIVVIDKEEAFPVDHVSSFFPMVLAR